MVKVTSHDIALDAASRQMPKVCKVRWTGVVTESGALNVMNSGVGKVDPGIRLTRRYGLVT